MISEFSFLKHIQDIENSRKMYLESVNCQFLLKSFESCTNNPQNYNNNYMTISDKEEFLVALFFYLVAMSYRESCLFQFRILGGSFFCTWRRLVNVNLYYCRYGLLIAFCGDSPLRILIIPDKGS